MSILMILKIIRQYIDEFKKKTNKYEDNEIFAYRNV